MRIFNKQFIVYNQKQGFILFKRNNELKWQQGAFFAICHVLFFVFTSITIPQNIIFFPCSNVYTNHGISNNKKINCNQHFTSVLIILYLLWHCRLMLRVLSNCFLLKHRGLSWLRRIMNWKEKQNVIEEEYTLSCQVFTFFVCLYRQ